MKKFIIKTDFTNTYILMASLLIFGLVLSTSSILNDVNGIDGWFPVFFAGGFASVLLALVNADIDKDKKIVGVHWKRVIIRTVLLSLIALVVLFNGLMHVFIPYLLYLGCMFAIPFDPVLNWKKGNEWDYTGSEAWYDRVQGKITIAIEIVVCIGSVFWFLKTV